MSVSTKSNVPPDGTERKRGRRSVTSLLNLRLPLSRVVPLLLLGMGLHLGSGSLSALHAQVGTVTGVVTAAGTGEALPGSQVQVIGTGQGSLSDARGRYTIENVPAGEVDIQVQRLGYAQLRETVTIAEGAVVTLDFELRQQVLGLDEIVVTGTAGGQQRRAIGNVVGTLDAASVVQVAPVRSVNELIGARTPGMQVLPSAGQVGTGSRIRVRGISSMALSNDPIVYIDGIRMDSDATRGPGQRGGSRVSRLDDLSPEDIESIEVIKGPSAATLYGTEASNGVIQIITKRGATGSPQFDLSVRAGTDWLWSPEERAGLRWHQRSDTGELEGVNIYRNERINHTGGIFGYGQTQGYNLNVRGGTDQVRYFASTSWDDQTGIVDWNWNKAFGSRLNLDLLLTDNLTVQLGTGYNQRQTRLAQPGINPDPFSNLIWSNPRTLNAAQRGWMVAPPEEWPKVQSRADNDRITTSLGLDYAAGWSTHRLTVGFDLNEEKNWTLYPRQAEGANHFFGQQGLGQKDELRATRRFLTVDYSGSAAYQASDDLGLTSSVGFQYYKTETSQIGAGGSEFPAPPITTISGGAQFSASEIFTENATVGVYFQQALDWRNRLFFTGAVRADDNSAFGAEFDAAIYPKVSAAWVVHEEPFWNVEWVDQFRLRSAWGAAGQQPGTFDAARLYGPEIGKQDNPALVPEAFGNPQLAPERGEELEIGFDASLLDGRVEVQFTRFERWVKDAIVQQPVPPSTGFSGNQIVNLAEVRGWGNEISVDARVFESPRLAWDFGTQISTTGSRVEDLGGLDMRSAGGRQEHRPGFPVGGFYFLDIVSAEIDSEGFVTQAMCDGGTGRDGLERGGAAIPCSEASRLYFGPSLPTWQVGLNSTVTLLGNLRLYARVDALGGHYGFNSELRAMHNLGITETVLRRDDPMVQATRALENDYMGLYEAGFARLREVSLGYTVPDTWSERVGATRASVNLSARNLWMLWTQKHGVGTPRDGRVDAERGGLWTWDPEMRSMGDVQADFQTVLPPTASANLTFRLSF